MGRLIKRSKKAALGLLLVVLLSGLQNFAISQDAVKIKRITVPVEFDGMPQESAWQSLDLFPLTMHKPNFGTEPSEKSDVRIGYDNEFLWVGCQSLHAGRIENICRHKKKG